MNGYGMLAQMDSFTDCNHTSETPDGDRVCGATATHVIGGESGHPGDFDLSCDAHLQSFLDLACEGAQVLTMVPVTRPPAAAAPAL